MENNIGVEQKTREEPTLHFKWRSGRYSVPIRAILYIESDGRHVFFYTAEQKYTSVGKIADYEAQLAAHGFLRIGYAFMVNMARITAIEKEKITLDDGRTVWSSVRKRAETRRAYQRFIEETEE